MTTTTIPQRPAAAAPTAFGRLRSLVRGHADDPVWARPLLIALLAGTLAAYLVDLTASGYSNSFYAAAVQAGTRSWKAFFFGSIDSSSFITVDKPPASLWVMELFGRAFGFSSASMLVPEVLEGVLSVALLAAAVRRWFGAGAGLLAGLALATTPVAALMFRFNNPDALMVCLMVASAYCLVRALEGGRTARWMLAVGALLGFAFLAKMMEAFLVLPGFALAYMVAAPVGVRRRMTDLLLGGLALLVSSGWWVAVVTLWPAASRPMIDGSSDNSILNLIFGYNGFGRLSAGGAGGGGAAGGIADGAVAGGAVAGGGGGASFSGSTGPLRLFNELMGGQASWLLPAALIVLVGGLVWRLRAPRTDRMRTALIVWGGWLAVSAAVFSFSSGVIHTYYTVELAPAIAALCGIGAATLWQRRASSHARAGMALIVLVTAGWAIVMLRRTPSWEPWLTPLVVVSALGAVCGLVAIDALRLMAAARRRVAAATAACAVVACLAAPTAYSVETLGAAHTGSVPSAGPAVSGGMGGTGGMGGMGGMGGTGGTGGTGGIDGVGGMGDAGGMGGFGGAMGGSETSSALVKALKADASRYRWVAATSGSQSAAALELASGGEPVMAIGGFNGNGGNLSLAQFKRYVKAGAIHYYVAGGGMAGGDGMAGGSFGASAPSSTGAPSSAGGPSSASGRGGTSESAISALFGGSHSGAGSGKGRVGGMPGSGVSVPGGAGGAPGGSQTSQSITTWVEAHYKAVTIGGQTVYDLTQPKS